MSIPGSSAVDGKEPMQRSCPHCGGAAVTPEHAAEGMLGLRKQIVCQHCGGVIDLTPQNL